MKKYPLTEGKISLGGPKVDFLNNPYSDKRDLIYIGERNYDDPLVKDALEGVADHKTDGSLTARKASKYVRRILHSLNKELIKQGGVKLRYRDLVIEEMEKPQIAVAPDGRIGYVLGYYDTLTKKLRLNPYMDEETLKKVTVHELIHYAQDKLGIIGYYVEKFGKKARTAIENETGEMVDKLLPEIYSSKHIEAVLGGRHQASLN